jgi:hypothetical protein
VTEALFVALDTAKLAKSIRAHRSKPDSTAAELDDVDARRSDLAAMFAAGEISRAEWMAARKPLEARHAALQATAARTQRSAVIDAELAAPGALRAAWDELSEDRRRAVLGAVIERVVVSPAVSTRGPIAERVAIRWIA